MTGAASSLDPSLRHAFEHAQATPPAPDEIAFFAQHLAREGPSLAAMCGAGRLLVPLVAAGHNVHGVDASAAAIALCEAQLAARAVTTPLFRQSLPDLNLPFRYAMAFIAGGALQQIFDPTLALAALSRVRAHLLAPSTLVVECRVPPEALHAPGAPVVEVRTAPTGDGATIVWRSETRIDIEGRRVDRSNRYEKRDGHTIVAREDERCATTWYSADELADLLRLAGFAEVTLASPSWGDDGGQRIVAIARG